MRKGFQAMKMVREMLKECLSSFMLTALPSRCVNMLVLGHQLWWRGNSGVVFESTDDRQVLAACRANLATRRLNIPVEGRNYSATSQCEISRNLLLKSPVHCRRHRQYALAIVNRRQAPAILTLRTQQRRSSNCEPVRVSTIRSNIQERRHREYTLSIL